MVSEYLHSTWFYGDFNILINLVAKLSITQCSNENYSGKVLRQARKKNATIALQMNFYPFNLFDVLIFSVVQGYRKYPGIWETKYYFYHWITMTKIHIYIELLKCCASHYNKNCIYTNLIKLMACSLYKEWVTVKMLPRALLFSHQVIIKDVWSTAKMFDNRETAYLWERQFKPRETFPCR